ncbi:MAG TPA: hypothetical protein VGD80_25720, partial [Kofleriaceae bacterium]
LVVRRAARGNPAREVSFTVAAGEPSDRIDARLAPVFSSANAFTAPPPVAAAGGESTLARPAPERAPPPAGGEIAPVSGAAPTPPGPSEPTSADHRERNAGIALAATGAVSLALGIALWSSYSSLQGQIDGHPTNNRNDFDDLTALEDRAATYAIAGDIAVIVGVAAGGLGAYYLIRSSRHHRVAIAPAPIARGAGLVLTIVGGP